LSIVNDSKSPQVYDSVILQNIDSLRDGNIPQGCDQKVSVFRKVIARYSKLRLITSAIRKCQNQ
jgi:hypothetical protein